MIRLTHCFAVIQELFELSEGKKKGVCDRLITVRSLRQEHPDLLWKRSAQRALGWEPTINYSIGKRDPQRIYGKNEKGIIINNPLIGQLIVLGTRSHCRITQYSEL